MSGAIGGNRDVVRVACDTVAGAAGDTYGDTVFRQAFRVGRSDVRDLSEAEAALVAAAVRSGLSEPVARSHVLRGLRIGQDRQGGPPDSRGAARKAGGLTSERLGRGRGDWALAERPPRAELEAFLKGCTPLRSDDEAANWVRRRGLDPDLVDLEVAPRCIPASLVVPNWARSGMGAWTLTGHRCLFPVYDAKGAIASVRARHVGLSATEAKALAPMTFSVRGSVLADGIARLLLRGGEPPTWNKEIVIVEGEPDFMTWCTNRSESTESTFGVLGVFNGAWNLAIADRIPSDAVVAVRTDCDAAGDAYAQKVMATLAGRCRVHRLRGDAP